MDCVIGDHDGAGCGEEVREKLLGLARSRHVRREQGGELGLGVRADDADHVDDGLELAVVLHEGVGELGVLDEGVLGKKRSKVEELLLAIECVGEILRGGDEAWVVGVESREIATCVAFGDSCDPQRAFETATRWVGDDRSGRIGLDTTTVELVDAPALDAVFECVLLIMPTSA